MVNRVAFGRTNLLDDLIDSHSLESVSFPADNVETKWPRRVFGPIGLDGDVKGGSFDIDPDFAWLDLDLGAGEVSIPFSPHTYDGLELANHVGVVVRAFTGDATFDVKRTGEGRRFSIERSTAFDILGTSGSHADASILGEIGFAAYPGASIADAVYAGQPGYQGLFDRVSTHSWIRWDAGSGKTIDPDVVLLQLDGDDDTDFSVTGVKSDVKVYSADATSIPTRAGFIGATASVEHTPSDRPSETTSPENTLQLAFTTADQRYWMLSWRHWSGSGDAKPRRLIGLAMAFEAEQPTTQTVTEIEGHELADMAEAIGPDNYYPVPLAQFWRLPLGIDQWPVAEYRSVLLPLARMGKTKGRLVMLNYNNMADGVSGFDVDDEVARGNVLWCSLPLPPGSADYSGAESGSVTSEMVAEQIR